LLRDEEAPAVSRQYLNRLSDLLFVLARHLNQSDGAGDVTWNRNRSEQED
jgi:cob(I)alamin adenosyltransferase